jgi:NAD(P)-dependent dehydrogenase (short-subunit alcohol dehydrogenase family)
VIGLTKSLGKELADRDIAVNWITPAAARTRIFDQMSEEHLAFMLSKIPRGRFLEVEEVASLVAWLASPENSFTRGLRHLRRARNLLDDAERSEDHRTGRNETQHSLDPIGRTAERRA